MSRRPTQGAISARLTVVLATVAIAGIGSVATRAAEGPWPGDGWASWSVTAVEGAPDWCCIDWQGRRASAATCRLDDSDGGYGSRDREAGVDSMRIYARMDKGVLKQVRALGPSCPVEAETAIADLGALPADDSVRWLASHLAANDQRATDLLAAVAIHAGPVARDTLIAVARDDADVDNRKDAVFWMGQVRASDSAEALESIMFDDADPQVREHAAFSLSQSDAPDRAAALIRLGGSDDEPEVRAKAWFWLVQTGAPESEAAIGRALAREADADVREQTIFALSQLPDERAVDALGAILDDPEQSREDRKRALFWLGQSDSARAQQRLAELLTDP